MVDSLNYKKTVNGYDFILMSDTSLYPDAIEFSPYSGEECPNGFLWELQHQICDFLIKDDEKLLNQLFDEKCLLTPMFDIKDIPENLKSLVTDRQWFDEKIENYRNYHKDEKLCGGLGAFIDTLFGVDALPLIAKIPMNYCPFCGAKLSNIFTRDNWWENEFKMAK